ncbi:MAG: hypothetical protein VZQ79_10520, partial [Ruminococcus sp.]|nr:hypothetical protein [Ruminococcus sp.]
APYRVNHRTIFRGLFQRLKPNDFEQVKAGVAYVASPADHIGRQSRPFRRFLDFSLGGLLKGRPDLEVLDEKEQIQYLS